jgi:uncharacterized membrane protein YciS (DUF1049 family)
MDFVLGFFIGLLVGAVTFYFVQKNNKEKTDLVVKRIEDEINRIEVAVKDKMDK